MAGIAQVITPDSASGAQVIDGSLKFKGASKTHLKRTVPNITTFTLSFWYKTNLVNRDEFFDTASSTGFTTITSSGSGTEGESHTIRIVNSGIATVGFSTYFLFPSGSAPSMPTADGAVSLISFTVHDSIGAGCTQLLAGASVNYS